jgi:hypothetical protein
VAIANAMIMDIPVAAKYMIMSELEVVACVADVGAGELDVADEMVAYVDADEV